MINLPELGFGTWELRGKECEQVVQLALEIGYRHIDTAIAYENHREVGKSIKGVERSSLFLTSKFFPNLVDGSQVFRSVEKLLEQSLRELDVDYLDLFLIHWPEKNSPLLEILESLHKLVEKGKLRFPGVSNYTEKLLQKGYDEGLAIPFNQVEFHPYLYQKQLLEFAKDNGTKLIAMRPFGKGELIQEEPLFAQIGEKYGKTAGQVILRWILQKGVAVIPKASSESHIRENFTIQDFFLSKEDEGALDHLNKNFRYCDPEWADFNN